MADYRRFSLIVDGHNVDPSSVRLSDLLGILGNLHTALMATAGGKKEQHHLSLVDVAKGSLTLVLEADSAVTAAAQRVATAIQNRSGEGLPQPAVASVRDLQRRLRLHDWNVTLANGNFHSTIKSDVPVFADPLVHGHTIIFGTVTKVGGIRPTASIVLLNSKHFTAELATKEIAQRLAPSLYKPVELHGDAWWYSSTMELNRFRVSSIGDFDHQASEPMRAFSELKERFGSVWDSIDPDEFVRQQREELSE